MTAKRTLLLTLLVACHSARPAEVQLGDPLSPINGPLPTDHAVLARLEAAPPCRPDLPPVRADADSVVTGVRCTLVSTALWAIEARRGAPAVFVGLSALNVANVRCVAVRAEAYRNQRTGEVDLHRWIV